MTMSPSQVRVVDPILSNHARGYRQAGLIGDMLLPIVDMPSRAAKRIEFGREAFRRYQMERAPGARVARIHFGYEGKPVNLIQRALQAVTPYEHQEEAAATVDIDLLQEGVDVVMSAVATEREINQATVARNAATYGVNNKIAVAGGAKWTIGGTTPDKVVNDGKEVIRAKIGRRPNTLVLGAKVASACRVHDAVKDKFKYTNSDVITDAMLAAYFDVEKLLVGDAIYDDDAGNTVDVWGNDAILAYVPMEGQRSMRLPGYGYTYRLRGHPFVEPTVWDNSIKSWTNDMTDEWSAELVGPDAGYLIQAAV